MRKVQIDDPRLAVRTIAATEMPNRVMYLAMHQDYSEGAVTDEEYALAEDKAGRIVVKRLLANDRGHFGVLEHPQITVNFVGFPHVVMQQLRTHRVGVSFDVQSFRYTGERILKLGRLHKLGQKEALTEVEDVFYLRPVGFYSDRQGVKYEYTTEQRSTDIQHMLWVAFNYLARVEVRKCSYEHARHLIPYCVRQHFVMSGNLRAMLHICDLRLKADVELETRYACQLLFDELKKWAPEVCLWYEDARLGKAKLSP